MDPVACLLEAMNAVDDNPDHTRGLLIAYADWRSRGGSNPDIPAAKSGIGADVTCDHMAKYLELALRMTIDE